MSIPLHLEHVSAMAGETGRNQTKEGKKTWCPNKGRCSSHWDGSVISSVSGAMTIPDAHSNEMNPLGFNGWDIWRTINAAELPEVIRV